MTAQRQHQPQQRVQEQVLALAGVAQAALLVDTISKTGSYDSDAMACCLQSLFEFDALNTEAVYGGRRSLEPGLKALQRLLGPDGSRDDQDVIRYVFNLLFLERKFSARADMISVVHSRLEHAAFKSNHFSDNPLALCRSLSGIYQDTLSTLKYRIKVNGSVQQLEQEANSDRIRALLLAGIRSAFLWRQLGGRRWRLPLQKRVLKHSVDALLRPDASV